MDPHFMDRFLLNGLSRWSPPAGKFLRSCHDCQDCNTDAEGKSRLSGSVFRCIPAMSMSRAKRQWRSVSRTVLEEGSRIGAWKNFIRKSREVQRPARSPAPILQLVNGPGFRLYRQTCHNHNSLLKGLREQALRRELCNRAVVDSPMQRLLSRSLSLGPDTGEPPVSKRGVLSTENPPKVDIEDRHGSPE